MKPRQASTRLYYMDNLRALAMLAGVFFHAALGYSPMMHSVWPSADQQNHWLFDVFAWGIHVFRMPVFFVMAGFFCALLLNKNGGKVFLKNRLLRIALPIVIFLPLLSIATMFVIQYALEQVQNKNPFLHFIQTSMALPEPPTPPFSTMHLWFLYHLLFLYLLAYAIHILQWHSLTNWVTSLQPTSLVLVLITTCVPALYAVSVPFPAPEWIFPALWALWFYGLFFALGYGFFSKAKLIEQFEQRLATYLLIGLISYVIYYYLLPENLLPDQQPQGFNKLVITILEATSAVLLTLSAVLYAKRFLNSNSVFMCYVAKLSYWVYIVHLPLIFYIQFLIMDSEWHLVIKFLVSSLGALAISILTFHLFVSWSWLSHILVSKSSR